MASASYRESSYGEPKTYAKLRQIYHVVNSTGMATGHAAHAHEDTVEICFVAKGLLRWWVGDTTFEIHPGDILVMMPGVEHGSSDSTLQPCEYYALHIDPSLLSPAIRNAFESPGFGGYHPFQSEAGDLLKRIYQEHAEPKPFSEETCESLLTLLITSLARNGMLNHPASQDNYLVYRAMRSIVQADYGQLTVDALADQLRVSTVWLTRVFQKEVGQAPGEWIRARKLDEAKRLLTETNESVIAIAIRLGFGSSQYFATAFRRDTGLSPSEYRERLLTSRKSAEGLVNTGR